jgi:hypothetical protein
MPANPGEGPADFGVEPAVKQRKGQDGYVLKTWELTFA